jgi:hypothetical protein
MIGANRLTRAAPWSGPSAFCQQDWQAPARVCTQHRAIKRIVALLSVLPRNCPRIAGIAPSFFARIVTLCDRLIRNQFRFGVEIASHIRYPALQHQQGDGNVEGSARGRTGARDDGIVFGLGGGRE